MPGQLVVHAHDALEFFIAGATAVSIGTANFVDPAASLTVKTGIREYLDRHNCSDIHSLIGSLSS